ncbi:hypothetical protein GOP47_0025166 [Adiantum capillus-veneris]|uniref:Uncharacterized protein n=1 Tax=Adiantum capillus-veneris TaxID=13818 RepID=A0A9D4Z5Q5_ADICA|nr:hypothetical protein GOP47_0025166 [Adiantum capillus-veneris]
MSWLPDPTKFLRRSYRKGDGENQEKMAKSKTPKSGSTLKHSSLYSLMQASSSNSLDKSAEEDENPSSHGAMEISTGYNAKSNQSLVNVLSDLPDASSSQVQTDELVLIRHAANILISNVPSLDGHTDEHLSSDIREDALNASQDVSHASDDDIQHSHWHGNDIPYISATPPQGNLYDAQHTFHARRRSDLDAPAAESRDMKQEEEEDESKEEEEEFAKNGPHPKRDLRSADEGNKITAISLSHAMQGDSIDNTDKGFPPANADSDDMDESECKVIAEDPAALLRAFEEGKLNSPPSSVVKERKKGRSSRKLGKRKNSTDQGSKREPNTRRNSVVEKNTQLSSRKSSNKGEGRMHRSKKNLQTKHSRESFEVPKGEPINKQGRLSGKESGHSSFSDEASTSVEESMENDPSERETTHSYMREATFNHRSGDPRVTRREYSLMPQESFTFQDMGSIAEKPRVSVGREHETTKRSPTLSAGRKELAVSAMQQEALRAQTNGVMDERARISFGHDRPKVVSKSPLMVSSPLMLQHKAHQEGEAMGDRARVSAGHNTADSDMRRSPYAVSRTFQSPSMSPIHQAFSSQEDEVAIERSRTSVGHDSRMVARRDIISSSNQRYLNSSTQMSDIRGERARKSVGYDAQELDSWRRSPLILAKEHSTPTSPHHKFSVRDNEVMGEGARVSMGRDASDFGSRSRPYMSERRELNSPLMRQHFLLQEHEGRARISFGHDDWELGSRQSPYIAGRRDQSLIPMVSSQRFYLQEDDLMSVYDVPTSPFSASQASLLLERGGSMFGDRPVSPLPNSSRFFAQNTEQLYPPTSPMLASNRFISHENQQTENRSTSPYNGFLLHEVGDAYEGEDASPRQGFYLERGRQREFMDDEMEPANQRASFYYNESRGSYVSRDDSNPLVSQRIDAFYLPPNVDEAEVSSEEYSENNEFSMSSASRHDNAEVRSHQEVVMVQQFLREQREMQCLQEDDGRRSKYDERFSESSMRSHHGGHQRLQYDERLSESSMRSHLILKQRSNASSKAEAMLMSPRSAAGSSVSSEKRMMKRLKEAQAKVAEVRHARRDFEEMVVEMVGSGGEDAVQDLLDLEEFVGSYESLSIGGLFKGVVDQFFHELCCELMQPVSQENDAVLSTALFRLEQICPSS